VARKVIEEIVDDYTGQLIAGDDVHHVHVAVGRRSWDLDLSTASLAALETVVEPFVVRAAVSVAHPARRAKAAAGRPADIKEWARQNGFEVAQRGRIPGRVMDAYQAAHSG
jgi:hypothetical protein